MLNRRAVGMAGAILALSLCAAPNPTRAGSSFEFLFSADRVSDDRQFFLNVAVSNSGYSRAMVEPILPRLRYVEADLPVVLFLGQRCGRPPVEIVDLRARGLSWSVIFGRVGVPYEALFQGVYRDPGPPYGNAWGHWKRSPRTVRLTDDEVCGLVQVQIGARAARMTPYEMARVRGRGTSVAVVVAEKRGRPYHAGHGPDGKRHPQGKPKGHGPHH